MKSVLSWILLTVFATLFFNLLWIMIPVVSVIRYFRNGKVMPAMPYIILGVVVCVISLVFFIITGGFSDLVQ